MLTTAFITEVQEAAQAPGNLTDAEILRVGDAIVRSRAVPYLRDCGANFLVRQATLALDAYGRARLPQRAVGAALRHVALVQGDYSVPLPLMGLEDVLSPQSGQPQGYYVDAGTIVALPRGTTGTLTVFYEVTPGMMVSATDTTQVAALTSVSVGASTTTVGVAAFSASTSSGLDIVSSGPAHECIAVSAPVTGTYVFTNTDLAGTAIVGDYLAYPRVTPFLPVPEEMSGAMVWLTTAELLRRLGYLPEAAKALEDGMSALADIRNALVPRNSGNPRRLRGGLRSALRGWW